MRSKHPGLPSFSAVDFRLVGHSSRQATPRVSSRVPDSGGARAPLSRSGSRYRAPEIPELQMTGRKKLVDEQARFVAG